MIDPIAGAAVQKPHIDDAIYLLTTDGLDTLYFIVEYTGNDKPIAYYGDGLWDRNDAWLDDSYLFSHDYDTARTFYANLYVKHPESVKGISSSGGAINEASVSWLTALEYFNATVNANTEINIGREWPSTLKYLVLYYTSSYGIITDAIFPGLISLNLMNTLVTGDLSAMSLPSGLYDINFDSCPGINYFANGSFSSFSIPPSIVLDNCGFSQSEMDQIFSDLVASGVNNGYLSIIIGNSSLSNPAGIGYKTILQSRGWTIT